MAVDQSQLESLRQQSEQSAQQASQMATTYTTLPDYFQQAVSKKLGSENPLVQQRESALKNFLTAGTQYNTETAQKYLPQGVGQNVIFSPTDVMNLLYQQRAAASVPLSTANLILGAEYGGIQNAIESATRAYQAQVQAAQAAAERQRQSYTDAYTQWVQEQQMAYQQQALAQQAALAREQMRASAGGGGLDLSPLFQAVAATAPTTTTQTTVPGGGKPGLLFMEIVNDIKQKGGNEYDVWKVIDQISKNPISWGIDQNGVNALWKLHDMLVQTSGGVGKVWY